MFPDNANVEKTNHLDYFDLKRIPADVLTMNQTEQTFQLPAFQALTMIWI